MKTLVKRSVRAAYQKVIGWMADPLDEAIAAKAASRGRNGLLWFTPEEAAIAQALGCIIIPSDEQTPGFDDIDVLGPPGIEVLDGFVAEDTGRQALYARGLLSFDLWARREYGRGFAELTREEQIALFRAAEQVGESWTAGSVPQRALVRIRSILQIRSGRYFAVKLFAQVIRDCFQVFYTSRVSWVWLEYDGPPMDEGYPVLTGRRDLQNMVTEIR